MRRMVAVMLIAAAVTACTQELPIRPVATLTPAPFPSGARPTPLRFERATVNLRPGVVIAAFRRSLECVSGGASVLWLPSRLGLTQSDFANSFDKAVAAAGFPTSEDANLWPQEPSATAYIVTARIEDMRATLCDEAHLLTGIRYNTQSGEARVEVLWRVFDPRTRHLALEIASAGYAVQNHPATRALWPLMAAAFLQAATNFSADPKLRALVLAPPPSIGSSARKAASLGAPTPQARPSSWI